ncbi:hypothetical protein Glove_24g49 [Diversispora epigaea]|uniref:Cyanovirin-N domain-containing protein n=1 Tax=Diversispora epigaea TaxID=1348612 RepID=A0A397JJV7_9GLOM|nr:hypothetical protein Glove_24g49 [Diversispora epigaea]
MNAKFIFALKIVIVSMILSAVAKKRNCNYDENKKRSLELSERRDYLTNDTCPCTVATAVFLGTFVGEVVFAQDPCGSTLVTGLFSDGFDPENNWYGFLIVDACGNLLYNLTSALDIEFRKNGTFPFSARLDDLNLDCDSDGVLLAECDDSKHHKHYHKRATGANLEVQENGQNFASAPINAV